MSAFHPEEGGRPCRALQGGRPSVDQIPQGHADRVRQEQQILKVGDALRVLPAVNGAVVAADALAELELRQAGVVAGFAEALPDLPASGWHPVGHRVEWHPITL